MRKLIKLLFSRVFHIGLFVLFELALFIAILLGTYKNAPIIYSSFWVINVLVVIRMFSKDEQSYEYKLLWLLIIMMIPPVGAILYVVFGKKSTDRKALSKLKKIYTKTENLCVQDKEVLDKLYSYKKHLGKNASYLNNVAKAPVYDNCKVEYLKNGQTKFEKMIEELKKAEKFICMEYFIIEPGKMLDTILEILYEKARQGVEVYFMYDDFGCVTRVPFNYDKMLMEKGIKVVKFNRLKPKLYSFMNYRDHRKITVIDGKVGFVGGINIADEYINEVDVFGYWKDTAVMIEGNAVWNLTVMFFQLWNFMSKEEVDIEKYKVTCNVESDGFVQPFGDDPFDDLNVAESNYINIINSAHEYIYITTPYLVIDTVMLNALAMASLGGVDVRIIVPGIPDKKSVFWVTQSYYKSLLKAGVKIYEYTPGFIHAKMFVSDDDTAVIGTINLDYRSLYLHFECGSVFYNGEIVTTVRDDILDSLDKCKQITLDEIEKIMNYKKENFCIFCRK